MTTASKVARELSPEIVRKLYGWHTLTTEILKLLNTEDTAAAFKVVGEVLAQAHPPSAGTWPHEMPTMIVRGLKEFLLFPPEIKVLEVVDTAEGALRTAHVATHAGITTTAARRLLERLQERGLVEKATRSKQTFWAAA